MNNQDQLIAQLGALTAALENQQTQPVAQAPAPVAAPQMTVPPEYMQQWMQKKFGQDWNANPAQKETPIEEPSSVDTESLQLRLEVAEKSLEKMHTGFNAMLTQLSQEIEARLKHLVMHAEEAQKQNEARMQMQDVELRKIKQALEQVLMRGDLESTDADEEPGQGMHDIVQDFALEAKVEGPFTRHLVLSDDEEKQKAQAVNTDVVDAMARARAPPLKLRLKHSRKLAQKNKNRSA